MDSRLKIAGMTKRQTRVTGHLPNIPVPHGSGSRANDTTTNRVASSVVRFSAARQPRRVWTAGCVRRVRTTRFARGRCGVRHRRAPAVHTDRRLVYARIRKATHARAGTGWVGVTHRQRTAIAPGAIVGEQAAVRVSRALPVRNAHALARRPVRAADAQDGVDARRLGNIGNAHALARRPVEAADAQGVLEALPVRRAGLLGADTVGRGADAAARVATHLSVPACTGPAGNRVGRTLDDTVVWAHLPGTAVPTNGSATRLARGTRHPRARDFR